MESKFKDLEILKNSVVNVKTIRIIECEWDGKKFSLEHEENTYNHKFSWVKGKEQFNEEERRAIEEYLYEETEFYLPVATVPVN